MMLDLKRLFLIAIRIALEGWKMDLEDEEERNSRSERFYVGTQLRYYHCWAGTCLVDRGRSQGFYSYGRGITASPRKVGWSRPLTPTAHRDLD